MNKLAMAAVAVGAMAQCGAIDLAKENWKVPNWNIIITEPGAVQKWVGKIWSGHCQGACVSSNAIYFSFHDQIVKTEVKDGQVFDFTEHGTGAGFAKFIER